MAKRIISTADLSTAGTLPLSDCLTRLGFKGYEPQIEQTLQRCDSAMPLTSKRIWTIGRAGF